MTVTRYRSVEEMPPPWRDPADPLNLRRVALMLALYRRFTGPRPASAPRIQKFRSLEEANRATTDPYRSPSPPAADGS